MRLAPSISLADLSEKEWSDQLIANRGNPGLARTLGWTACYHVLRSKGSDPGFPDWLIARDRIILLELKTEHGKLSTNQKLWQQALISAGAETYVVRPHDLEMIGHILSFRGNPLGLGVHPYTGHAIRAATAATQLVEQLKSEIR